MKSGGTPVLRRALKTVQQVRRALRRRGGANAPTYALLVMISAIAATGIAAASGAIEINYRTIACTITGKHCVLDFPPVLDAALNAEVVSASVQLEGFSGDIPIGVVGEGNALSLDGGDWVASATATEGQSVRLRTTSAKDYLRDTSVYFTAGDRSASWLVRTVDRPSGDQDLLHLSFEDVIDADPGQPVVSSIKTVTEFAGPLTVTVAGIGEPAFSIDGGEFTAGPGQLNPGDTLQLRQLSGVDKGASAQMTVTVGSLTVPWRVVTTTVDVVKDMPLDQMKFAPIRGATPKAYVLSDIVRLQNFTGVLPVSLSGDASGEFSINGAAWTRETGALQAGWTLRLRQVASASFDTTDTVTVTVGPQSADWTVTTRADNSAPQGLAFSSQFSLAPGQVVYSNVATLRAFDGPLTIGFVGEPTDGTQALLSINGGPWVSSGSVVPNDTVQLSASAAADFGAKRTVTVLAGTGQNTWTMSTRDADTLPDSFAFPAVRDQLSGSTVPSAEVILTGFDLQQKVTVAPVGNTTTAAQFQIDGGPFGVDGSISAGQRLRLQGVVPDGSGTTSCFRVMVGSGVSQWCLSSAEPFQFSSQGGLDPDSEVTSNARGIPASPVPLTVSLSTDLTASIVVNGVDTGKTTAAVNTGDRVAIHAKAPSTFSTVGTVGVTAGPNHATWQIATREEKTVPDPPTEEDGSVPGETVSTDFRFAGVIGAPRGTLVFSNIVAPQILQPTSLSLSGDGGAKLLIKHDDVWGVAVAAPVTVTLQPGDYIQLQMTASAQYYRTELAKAVLGGSQTANWSVTTEPDPATGGASPGALAFTPLTDLTRQTLVSSNIVKLTLPAPAQLVLSGEGQPTMRVQRDGTWIAVSGNATQVQDGDLLQLSTTTADSYSTAEVVDVALDGDTVHWIVTTASESTPDPVTTYFHFDNLSNQKRGVTVTSNVVQMALDGQRTLSVSGDGNPRIAIERDGVVGVPVAPSATLQSGDKLQLLVDTSVQYGEMRTVTARIGTVSTVWAVSTEALPSNATDSARFAGSFAAVSKVDPLARVASNAVVFTGLSAPMTLTLSGDTSAAMIVDGVDSGTSATVSNGSSLLLRITAANAFSSAVSAVVTPSAAQWNPATWTVTTRARLATPKPFSFDPVKLVAANSLQTTSAVVSGFEGTLPVTVQKDATYPGAPFISVNGGAWVSADTVPAPEVGPSQTVAIKLNAPVDLEKSQRTTVSVGPTSAPFDVTTDYDAIPAAVAFSPTTMVSPGAKTRSNTVTLKEFTGSVLVSANSGAKLTVNGSDTGSAATLAPGDRFSVFVNAPMDFDTELPVTVSVAGLPDTTWSVRSRPALTQPTPLGVAAMSNVEPSTRVVSAPVTLAGFDNAIALSVSGPVGNPLLSINNKAWVPSVANALPGDVLRLSMDAAAPFGTTVTATLVEGTGSAGWNVTTRAIDTVPTVPSFGTTNNALPSSDILSPIVTVSAFDGTLPISVASKSGYPSARVSAAIDGIWYQPGQALPDIRAGQTVQLKLPTGVNHDADYAATVTVNGVTSDWYLRTGPDNLPEPMLFNYGKYTTEPNTVYTSGGIAVCSFDTPMLVTLSVDIDSDDAPSLLVNGTDTGKNQVQIDPGSGACNNGTWPVLAVRMKSPSAYSTDRKASLTVGPYATGTWTLATRARSMYVYGNAYSSLYNQAVSTAVTSENNAITGFDEQLAVRVLPTATATAAAPKYRITPKGGSTPATWTDGATSSMISAGDKLQIQMTTSAQRGTQQIVSVTIGSTTRNWMTQTASSAVSLAGVSFTSVPNADADTAIFSNAQTISTSASTVMSMSVRDPAGDPGLLQISNDGGATFGSGPLSVVNGSVVQVMAQSSPLAGVTRNVEVSFTGAEDGVQKTIKKTWAVTTRTPDSTPNAFVLTPNNQVVDYNTWVQSNAVQISGFDAVQVAKLTLGGADAGAEATISVQEWGFPGWTEYTSGQTAYVPPDANIRVKLRSGATFADTRTLNVAIGGTSANFVVATKGLSAANFSFPTKTGLPANTLVESDPVQLTGWAGNTTLAPAGPGAPKIAVLGGDGTWSAFATSQTVSGGQTVKLQMTTDSDYLITRTIRLTVGTTTGYWTAQTMDQPDSVPDAYAFDASLGSDLNATVTSADTVLTGYDPSIALTVFVNGPGSPKIRSFNSDTGWSAWSGSGSIGNVHSGDHIQLQAMSASDYQQTRRVDVTAGGVKAGWSFTTRNPPDTEPDDFSIPATDAAAVATATTSQSVPVLGIDVAIPLTVSGDGSPTVSINGKPFINPNTVPPATVVAGDSVRVQATSASDYSQARSVVLHLGSKSATWVLTTRGKPVLAPSAFSFADTTGQDLNVTAYSAQMTVSGVEEGFAVPASITGNGDAAFRINGTPGTTTGTWYPASANPPSVRSGDKIDLRMLTASDYSQSRSAALTVGGVRATWTASTRAVPDVTPDNFAFVAAPAQPLYSTVYSDPIVVSGLEDGIAVAVSIVGDGTPAFQINGDTASTGGVWVPSNSAPPTVKNGDTVRVKLISASDYGQARAATVTIGGVKGVWTVTTMAKPSQTVDAFSFDASPDQPLNAIVESSSITVAGLGSGVRVPLSVTGPGAPAFRINNGSYVTATSSTVASVANGDVVQLRTSAAPDYAIGRAVVLTLGSVTGTWSVTTLARTPSAAIYVPSVEGAPVTSQIYSDYISTGYSAAKSIAFAMDRSTAATISTNLYIYVYTATGTSSVGSNYFNMNSCAVSGGSSCQAAVTVQPGQRIRLMGYTPDIYSYRERFTVTVDGVSSEWNITTRPPYDTVPNPFAIAAVDNAQVKSTVYSSDTTITGFDTAVSATLTMEQATASTISTLIYIYAYNQSGGSATATDNFNMNSCAISGGSSCRASIVVQPGQKIRIQTYTPDIFNNRQHFTVTISGVAADWYVSTRPAYDTVPDPFSLTAVDNAAVQATVYSADTTITGTDYAATAVLTMDRSTASNISTLIYIFAYNQSGGSATATDNLNMNSCAISGGSSCQASIVVQPGQKIRLQTYTPNAYSSRQHFTVNIGGVTGEWYVTTRQPYDVIPDPFTIAAVDGAGVTSTVYSDIVPISGTDAAVTATLTMDRSTASTISTLIYIYTYNTGASSAAANSNMNMNSCAISGGSSCQASIVVQPGQRIRLQTYTPNAYSSRQRFTVAIGGVSADWYVTTRPPYDTVPDPFTIAAVDNAALTATVYSDFVTVSGTDAAVTATVTMEKATASPISALIYIYVYNATGTSAAGNGNFNMNSCSLSGGSSCTASIAVQPGQRIRLQTYTPGTNSSRQHFTVAISGISAEWYVTTKPAPDTVPDPFAVPAKTGVAVASGLYSDFVTMVGYDAPTTLTVELDPAGSAAATGTAYIYVYSATGTSPSTNSSINLATCASNGGAACRMSIAVAPDQRFRIYTVTPNKTDAKQRFNLSAGSVSTSWLVNTVSASN